MNSHISEIATIRNLLPATDCLDCMNVPFYHIIRDRKQRAVCIERSNIVRANEVQIESIHVPRPRRFRRDDHAIQGGNYALAYAVLESMLPVITTLNLKKISTLGLLQFLSSSCRLYLFP
jgi:hypothetical protein